MEWDEINRRIKNGTTIQILADLDGINYNAMVQKIRWHEKKDGKQYITPEMCRPSHRKELLKQMNAGKVSQQSTKDTAERIQEKQIQPETRIPKKCIDCVSFCPGFYCEEFDKDIENVLEAENCQCYYRKNEKTDNVRTMSEPVAKESVDVSPAILIEIKGKIAKLNTEAALLKKMAEEWEKVLALVMNNGKVEVGENV